MATALEYRGFLKDYLKDHADVNRLLEFMRENSDDELDLYLNMALGTLNFVPPFLGPVTFETFPMPPLIVHQAVIECLISNSVHQSRNELTYNNGGITLKIPDGDRYLKILQQLYRSVDLELNNYKQYKIQVNIDGGFGGVPSPYSYLHGRNTTLRTSQYF